MRDAGIIGFVPRGEYSDTETYDFLQFVYYKGSTYVAKKETTGNEPEDNNEFWQILAKGEVGNYLPIDGTAKDSEKLGGYEVTKVSSKIWGSIPRVDASGVMEVGKYIDFHESADDFSNFYIRVTAKDGGLYIGDRKILVEGNVISADTFPTIILKRNQSNFGAGIDFINNTGRLIRLQTGYNDPTDITSPINLMISDIRDINAHIPLFRVSTNNREIYDANSKTLKKILVSGDSITPTVKETILKTSTGDLTVYGVNGNTETNITDIFNKANTINEGMRFGVSPTNGMGYIQSQNFELNCALLTEQERKLLQSFTNIRISKSNNSDDYPLLKPEIFNFCTDMWVNGQNGNKQYFVKMQIKSDNTQNYFQYALPSDFKTDDFSKNILILRTSEWCVATGIDIKNRG